MKDDFTLWQRIFDRDFIKESRWQDLYDSADTTTKLQMVATRNTNIIAGWLRGIWIILAVILVVLISIANKIAPGWWYLPWWS